MKRKQTLNLLKPKKPSYWDLVLNTKRSDDTPARIVSTATGEVAARD